MSFIAGLVAVLLSLFTATTATPAVPAAVDLTPPPIRVFAGQPFIVPGYVVTVQPGQMVPNQAVTQAGDTALASGEYTRIMVDAVAFGAHPGDGADLAAWPLTGTDGHTSIATDLGGAFYAGGLQQQHGHVLHGYLYYAVGQRQLGASLATPAGKIELTTP